MVASRLSESTPRKHVLSFCRNVVLNAPFPVALMRNICLRFNTVNVNFLYAYVYSEMSFPTKNLHSGANLFSNYYLSFDALFMKSTYVYVVSPQIVVRCLICLIFIDDKLRHNLVKV